MVEIIKIFLRLGFLGFGGPFAMIAMMEEEFVKKRKWIEPSQFSQAFAMIKVLPGATASQIAIYIARERAGTLGGLVGGVVFILPSALFVLLLSVFYVRAQDLPQVSFLFQGMQVGALVAIADSVGRMAKPYVKEVRALLIGLVSGIIIFVHPSFEPFLILGMGLIGLMGVGHFAFFSTLSTFTTQLSGSTTFKLTMICLKTGFLVFGTGLAIIPVLEADVVGNYHWLTHSEFLDGLAFGQITPGPVSTTATFIGYKVAGFTGAFWATAAIFASAFFNILILLPLVEHLLRGSPKLKVFTDWAFPAVIGGIVATSVRLGITTINSRLLLAALVVLAVIAYRWRPPAWLLILSSGVIIFSLSRIL